MNDFRRCLEELDIAGARRLWAETHPHLHQPADDAEALIMVHRARTEAKSIPLAMRLYSHAWLVERLLPSGLPDDLRPIGERVYPRIVTAVGISVNSVNNTELAKAVQRAMSDAVADAYADGNEAPAFVRARMDEARAAVLKHQ